MYFCTESINMMKIRKQKKMYETLLRKFEWNNNNALSVTIVTMNKLKFLSNLRRNYFNCMAKTYPKIEHNIESINVLENLKRNSSAIKL